MRTLSSSSLVAAVVWQLLVQVTCAGAQVVEFPNALMFVTSISGSTNLGTWPGAGGKLGVEAGDKICQARADAAGLPGNYRAWLSDADDDVFCRIRGLTGTIANNCEDAPPVPLLNRGPWLMTDGEPFGEVFTEIVHPNYVIYHPPQVDEFGHTVPSSWLASGSNANGTRGPTSCNNWSSTLGSSSFVAGHTDATQNFMSLGTLPCTTTVRLACFQDQLLSNPLPPFEAHGRLAFVTNDGHSPNLGSSPMAGGFSGLDAGDAICQATAASAGLPDPGSFVAWLSATGVSAKDRFVFDGPWVRPDGVLVAQNLDDLTDGRLRTPINVGEDGSYRAGRVWTGTAPDGGSTGEATCADWTSTSGLDSATSGEINWANVNWTSGLKSCASGSAALYCLADVDVGYVFSDGFESGTTNRWSSEN